MTTHAANDDDHDDPATVLISDRDLDDLATAIIAMEDARAAWQAECAGEALARSAPRAPAVRCAG